MSNGMQSTHFKIVPNGTQKLTVSGTSAQSAVIGNYINTVRVISTTNCHIAVGVSPTATTDDFYLPAGLPEYLRVPDGGKVAVIQNSAGGSLYISEMTA